MFSKLGATLLAAIWLVIASASIGQSPAQPAANTRFRIQRKLTGDDEKRAQELEAQIENALKADRFDEAIARTENLVALRAKVLGPKHFETASTEWQLNSLADWRPRCRRRIELPTSRPGP